MRRPPATTRLREHLRQLREVRRHGPLHVRKGDAGHPTERHLRAGKSLRQRMTGHQVIRMRPAGQSLHAVEPRADVLVLSGDVETELLGRIIEITGQRYVGDGRRDTQNVRTTRQTPVENRHCAVGPALEEFHHRRMAGWFREVAQEAVWPERESVRITY
jgi:hypothetical protein